MNNNTSSNPAEIIYGILISLSDYRKSRIRIINMWEKIFNLEERNQTKIFVNISNIVRTIEDLKLEINKLEDKTRGKFDRSIQIIENAFLGINFSGSAEEFASRFDDMTIQSLSFAVDILNLRFSYQDVDLDKLYKIQEDINGLIDEIETENFDIEFKKFIINELSNLNSAITEYRLTGVKSLRDAVDKGIGSIIINTQDIKEDIDKNNSALELIKKTVKIFGDVNTVITLGKNVVPLLEQINNFIQ